MKLFLLAVLLAMLSAYAQNCSGSIQMGLPAVSEGEAVPSGSIILVKLHLVPGSGLAFVSAEPNTDAMLQESFAAANREARALAGENPSCDVLLEVTDNESREVSGPSGGAAFALMDYALLSGQSLRTDTAITGTVMPGGMVGSVGGLYEKALGAKESGKKYFITPVQSIDERIMLREIRGIQIYEVENLREARDFFVYGDIPAEKKMNLSAEPLPPLENYSGDNAPEFRGIAEKMVEREEEAVRNVDDADARAYFGQKLPQQQELIEKGYYYTAANDAFLSYVLADSLSEVAAPDVEGKMQEVDSCISSAHAPPLTYENYQWIMGADARIKRAENQVAGYADYTPRTREEDYLVVYELDYALAWCDAAKDMYSQAQLVGGWPMKEEVLRSSADSLINISVNYTGIEDSENYKNGMEMYAEGKYAGAVHEIMYAIAYAKEGEVENAIVPANVTALNSGERSSLWGKIFQAHSAYLLAANDSNSAYATAIFSLGMEEVGREIEYKRMVEEGGYLSGINGSANASSGENTSAAPGNGNANGKCECPECANPIWQYAFVLLLAILIFTLIIKRVWAKRRSG